MQRVGLVTKRTLLNLYHVSSDTLRSDIVIVLQMGKGIGSIWNPSIALTTSWCYDTGNSGSWSLFWLPLSLSLGFMSSLPSLPFFVFKMNLRFIYNFSLRLWSWAGQCALPSYNITLMKLNEIQQHLWSFIFVLRLEWLFHYTEHYVLWFILG